MEPIPPDFPWQSRQDINALPEAQLLYAVILQAWEDANKPNDCSMRRKAREWFSSNLFEYYCGLLGISSEVITERFTLCWSESENERVKNGLEI